MAIIFRSIVGVLVICCIAACGSTEKTGNGEENSDSNDESAISNDKIHQQAHQNLAPGTAMVHIELSSAGKESPGNSWQAVIKEVLGYGSATPPLSVGTELAIQTRGYFSNVSTDPADVMDRDKIICVIQHQESPGNAGNQSWRLVDIVDQSKN